MGNKTITITEEQFFKALSKVNDEWLSLTDEKAKENPSAGAMMMMHNMLFGATLAKILFNENKGEE
jgi:hypothetical protein